MLQHKQTGTLAPLTLCMLLAAAGVSTRVSAQANPELGDTGGAAGGTAKATWQPPTGDQRAVAAEAPVASSGDTSSSAVANTTSTSAPGGTDHAAVVGDWGVGFFGIQNVPVCRNIACDGTINGDTLAAPTVGIRYWLSSLLGIEAAIGFASTSGGGSIKTPPAGTTQNFDDRTVTAFALHGGVPLALADSKHFTFEVIPEMNLGFAGGSLRGMTTAQDETYGGNIFELGGRIGAEVHFGFIDLPKLALVGSLGLLMHLDHRSSGLSDGSVQRSHNTFNLATTVYNKPWEVFTGNISAIYYF